MMRAIVRWILLFPLLASAQPGGTLSVETFDLSGTDSLRTFTLSRSFIIPSSIRITIDSLSIPVRSFDRSSSRVEFLLPVDLRSATRVRISYTDLPLRLRSSYALRSLIVRKDSAGMLRRDVVSAAPSSSYLNLFGPELTKSGSISRGFLVGSNRDLTVTSGFRLQMAGKLSSDVDILAALTDENTPIQPQGNTQTLQEIDNVFVEVKSPNAAATLGDFIFTNPVGEFSRITRKLQGAEVTGSVRDDSRSASVSVTAASSRGKFNTNTITGIEGVQGPYRLTGKNGERSIIIIAGSEKVYVDGVAMVRGETNDYSIDYASCEIIFSTQRLITGASRITVDFEYTDRQYTRNFTGVSADTKLSSDVSLGIRYYREADDPDAPIDLSLSEADKAVLRSTDGAFAQRSGIVDVGVDSLGMGRGNYAAVDTVIGTDSIRFYRFAPLTPEARFQVAFSSVGAGAGSYVRDRAGQYRFVGINAGPYAPVVLLPAPQLHQMVAMNASLSVLNGLTLTAEGASSTVDLNRFSPLGENGGQGNALLFSARYRPSSIKIGNTDLGTIDLSLSDRIRESSFTPFDRADAVEFGRKWSTDSLTASQPSSKEEIREASLRYSPLPMVSLSGGYGSMDRTAQFRSDRTDAGFDITANDLPSLSYYAEKIHGADLVQLRSNDWFRQKIFSEYSSAVVRPSFLYEEERRRVIDDRTDSLDGASYAFRSFGPKLNVMDVYGFDLGTDLQYRTDDAADAGHLVRRSRAVTQSYSAALREAANFSASGMVTFRDIRYEKAFQSVNTNQRTMLIKAQSRYRPFAQGVDIDLVYDAASQRTAKLERIFYKVRKGEGQYVWVDANNDGVVDIYDEKEFRPDRYDGEYIIITMNSDSYIPVVTLKSSSRIRLTPSRIIGRADNWFTRSLSAISTETFLRIEERSTESNTAKIYLLDRSAFLNPATTQNGTQFFQQDLSLFEFSPEMNFRFRFNERNGLSRYAAGLERNNSRERSVRGRFRFGDDISDQTDLIWKDDNAVSSSTVNQSRLIGSTAVSTDLTYRPAQNQEFGLRLESQQSVDRFSAAPVTADFNGQTVRYIYGFLGNGQIRTEFAREEVLIGPTPSVYTIPYDLTAGRDVGRNFLWTAGAEYRMTGNVQFSLQYNGRTTSRSVVVHTGRMEVRASF